MKLPTILFAVLLAVVFVSAGSSGGEASPKVLPTPLKPLAATNGSSNIEENKAQLSETPAAATSLASNVAQDDDESKHHTTTKKPITHPTTPSTTPSTNPTTPTTPPTTPSTHPTTPSTNPTTPSTHPTTPSTPPTTPVPTTVPTTPAPTAAPTTPTPPGQEYYWNVSNEAGHNCILAKADIKLELTYLNKSSGNQDVSKEFTIPHNASSSGSCGNSSQTLNLLFDRLNSITFVFTSSNTTSGYSLTAIHSTVSLPDGNSTKTISLASNQLSAFSTKQNTSYQCSWSEPATLKEDDGSANSTKSTLRVVLSNIHIEAFRASPDNAFSKVYSCTMDSPDIVPIMVGIALGILVAVVLIAYLVGRRNTQAQGYLSM